MVGRPWWSHHPRQQGPQRHGDIDVGEKVEVENVARYSSAALSLRLFVAAELLLPARLLYRELLSIRWPCAHVLIGHATMTSLRETKSNHAKCKVLL